MTLIPIKSKIKPTLVGNQDVQTIRHRFLKRYPCRPLQPIIAEVGMAIADCYQSARHAPSEPDVASTYRAFISETVRQFHTAEYEGLILEPWTCEGQPYAHSDQMRDDVRLRKHLFFFTGGDLPTDHPMAAVSGVMVREIVLSFNDVFRAVHDLFGHAQHGFDFSPLGEENAWFTHSRMYSSLAVPALTTETRGQNSWVNFGPHLRRPDGSIASPYEKDFIPPKDRPYSPQKAALLPKWCRASSPRIHELLRVAGRDPYRQIIQSRG